MVAVWVLVAVDVKKTSSGDEGRRWDGWNVV